MHVNADKHCARTEQVVIAAACPHSVTESRTNRQLPATCRERAAVTLWGFLSVSVSLHRCVPLSFCACVCACKACRRGCGDLPSRAHPQPGQRHLAGCQSERGKGEVECTSQPITYSLEIQFPQHTALICTPTPGFYLARRIVSQIGKASGGRLLQWGPSGEKYRNVRRREKKMLTCEYFLATVERKSPDLFVIPFPLVPWKFICISMLLYHSELFYAACGNKDGLAFSLAFPCSSFQSKVQMFFSKPPLSKPSTEQKQSWTLIFAGIDTVLSISMSIPGQNRRSDKNRFVMVVS